MLDNISATWQRAGLAQRVTLLGLVLGLGAAAVLLLNWARKPDMTLLYSHLAPEEAAKIVEKIRDADVPYELKDGGTTICVPTDKVYSLRLAMASQGLPLDDQMGYRILDNESFGSSPFKQHVNYKRALEGELAKSIQLVNGVLAARVHIVKPENKLFGRKEDLASATVVLKLRGDRRLTAGHIDAIVHLVAGAVEGLGPANVVVVDSTGALLSGAEGKDDFARRAGSLVDYKTQIEEYLADKAEEMLTAVLGPNRASVRVAAVIDTSSVNNTKETYDPVQKVIRREEIKSSSSTSPAPQASEGAKAPSTKEETTSTEYAISKIIEQKVDLPGQVKSLSVGAFVDLSSAAGKDGEAATSTITLKDVEEILRSALGLTEKDQLKVVDAPFNQPAPVEAPPEEAGLFSLDGILKIVRNASLGLLAIGALLVLKILGGKKVPDARAAPALEGQAISTENLLSAGPEINPEILRNRISRALRENPEEVKGLFLRWVQSTNGEQ